MTRRKKPVGKAAVMRARGLTLAHVRTDLRKRGITVLCRDGEYCVKFKGTRTHGPSSYFTQDLGDALNTGTAMATDRDARRARVLGSPSGSPPTTLAPPPLPQRAGPGEGSDLVRATAAVRACMDAYGVMPTMHGLCMGLLELKSPYADRLMQSISRFMEIAKAVDHEVFNRWVATRFNKLEEEK